MPCLVDPWQIIAALAGALATVSGFLWREYQKATSRELEDVRRERDRYAGLLDLSLQNNRDAISAWGKRDATDAARKRQSD